MGFWSVYKALLEIFPQIDARIMKAVALEHSKDVESAVDFILLEILSSKDLNPSNDFNDSESLRAGQPEFQGKHDPFPKFMVGKSDVASPSSSSRSAVATNPIILDDTKRGRSLLNDVSYGSSISSSYYPNGSHVQVHRIKASENQASLPEEIFENFSTPVVMESSSLNDLCAASSEVKNTEELSLHEIPIEKDISPTVFSPGKLTPDFKGCIIQIENCQNQNSLDSFCTNAEEQSGNIESNVSYADLAISSVADIETQQINVDIAHDDNNSIVEDATTLSTVVMGSEQICRVDLLEDMIEDSKNNKKILFSAVDSVVNLMKRVELEEKAVENARDFTSKADTHIFQSVIDMKQMLQRAQEGNNMHAGEVHGEKSILATEAKELQARLLGLSDERDKSLAILNEMREILEKRLAAAEEEKKAYEVEKVEKEESARGVLAEQELMMEKVVSESKLLHQQAEENSKLREFLMDRGRSVDILRGEVSVICEDVALLKKKFDEGVPVSKSISGSQTSCILASSSSSLKSAPNPNLEEDDHKDFSDDGWDFFDRDSELNSNGGILFN